MSLNIRKINIQKNQALEELASLSKYASQEGIVLLENKNDVLPLIDKKVAVFGRIQTDYYKSGTGSGGLVNVGHVPSIIECLTLSPRVHVDLELFELYKNWISDHPFDQGSGQWASEPWAQKEMPLDKALIKQFSKKNDVAIVVFGRTAGEDRDNFAGKGSYYLSDAEELLLKDVTQSFKHTVVILNVGNAVDLSFMDKYRVDGLIFAWHGGQFGAEGLVDVITGYISPTGKLPMTLAKDLTDYPSHKNFGHQMRVIYEEDIYVGYRYFETFNKQSVRYPFGYGLTYSTFLIEPVKFDVDDQDIFFEIKVTNTGKFIAKEVVQVYVEAPQGYLGKPKKVLVAFSKTKGLKPNESTIIQLKIDLFKLASYDDVGYIYKSAYVLEKGNYQFYIGSSISETSKFGLIQLNDDLITEVLSELNAPIIPFKRFKPNTDFSLQHEDVPQRTVDYNKRIEKEMKSPLPVNDESYSLLDVYNQKISMNAFIGSLSVDQLIEITRGEGMSSPKVTSGTAAAFGGVTPELAEKGIPIACAADGPSGIRMDSGFYASSLPIGVLLASTFNPTLIETLYELVGLEMRGYHVDILLGPGMNIHRHPLNGRNFEYFSEDPLLTGIMGAAVVKGLQKSGVTGTLKHIYANNQETDRFNVDAVISERAQREIYLKGFEIAVKMGKAQGIMTAYNPVNGLWCASNYDINKKMIRDEWGFKGIIVTDWWAKMNDFGGDGTKTNTKAMIISQNDLYMVISDAKTNSNNDNSKESYEMGLLSLAQLQTTAKNIISYLMTTPAFYRLHQLDFKKTLRAGKDWFRMQTGQPSIPLMMSVSLNGKKHQMNPFIFNQRFETIDMFHKILAKSDRIELNDLFDHAVVVKENDGELNIYHLNAGLKNYHSHELVDISSLSVKPHQTLKENAWEPTILSFDKVVHQNDGIDITDHAANVTAKDGHMSYAIYAPTRGKYIFEFALSTDANELAQLPFSLYADNHHKATLTIHGTNNQKITTRAFVLLVEGNHIITFKFNKSGIRLYEIKCMRHG